MQQSGKLLIEQEKIVQFDFNATFLGFQTASQAAGGFDGKNALAFVLKTLTQFFERKSFDGSGYDFSGWRSQLANKFCHCDVIKLVRKNNRAEKNRMFWGGRQKTLQNYSGMSISLHSSR